MISWPRLALSHSVAGTIGILIGIYLLPILTAPPAPDTATLEATASQAIYTGQFNRSLPGSDLLHWGDGEVRVLSDRIAHVGRLAPGPDYKLYLAPYFVSSKAQFEEVKARSQLVGDIKSFSGFVVPVPAGVDVHRYRTVVIWCERFRQFITAAQYRPASNGTARLDDKAR